MGWLKFAAVAMCVWGTTSFAALPDAVTGSAQAVTATLGGERQELQTISSWMAHLNFYFPAAQVTSGENLQDPGVRKETLQELKVLEDVLRGEAAAPTGSLMFISCSNIVCGGGDGGKCIKCSAED